MTCLAGAPDSTPVAVKSSNSSGCPFGLLLKPAQPVSGDFPQRLVFAIHCFKGAIHSGKGWKKAPCFLPVEMGTSLKD